MAVFDQRNQKVAGNQYNAGHDLTINQNQERAFVPETRRASPNTKPPPPHLIDKHRQLKAYSALFCYAREDEPLLNQLKNHLAPLQRQGLLTTWHDRHIDPGERWEQELHNHLNTVDIILLLISPDFMASDYCYSIEMRQALRRYEMGKVILIPIILRPVYWHTSPLGDLQVLPTDAQPVLNSSSRTPDEAFFDVTAGICRILEQRIAH